ncbi:hypothetical protein OAV88_02645 [bacterium]|nr:hypothetical protein [bacterium]
MNKPKSTLNNALPTSEYHSLATPPASTAGSLMNSKRKICQNSNGFRDRKFENASPRR